MLTSSCRTSCLALPSRPFVNEAARSTDTDRYLNCIQQVEAHNLILLVLVKAKVSSHMPPVGGQRPVRISLILMAQTFMAVINSSLLSG